MKAQISTTLNTQPVFSIGGLISNQILLEKTEDREHLREGLLRAGLPD